MIKSPKNVEEKMHRMLNAWKTLAPDKTFGGMTLAQFEKAVEHSMETRTAVAAVEDQRMQAIAARETADENFLTKAQLVVAGVLADPTEGADSALYEAMGYVRKSDRRSGLTRKKTGTANK